MPHRPRAERSGPRTSTTLAIVATDAGLDKTGVRRLAEAGQTGLARAVWPSHTLFDGDLVFGVSTGARPVEGSFGALALEHAAALCVTRAIARAVHAARPAAGNLLPCWCELKG